MYAPFFGLSKEPFSIAPDPRFLFMSEQHREALAHLLYGLGGGGGFVLLTGEIGAGKTTVCRCFLEQVPPTTAVAYIFNPKLTVIELLQMVCGEFGIPPPAAADSVKAHVDALNGFLLAAHAAGRNAVLVIDEAQSLSADVLEQLRLLTNLETTERKLLQIVLIGQPELREMLAAPGLEQLAQRVIARYHLGALGPTETPAYIRHRLSVAGPATELRFDARALARVHRLSGGVPRRINLLADRALLGAYAQGRRHVDARTVAQAAREVFARGGRKPPATARQRAGGLLLLALAAVVAVLGGWIWQRQQALGVSVVAAAPSPAASSAAAALAAASSVAPAASAASALRAASAVAALAAPAGEPPAAPSNDPGPLLAAALPAEATAWRELALHWNVAIGEGDPCQAVAQAEMACFRAPTGGLSLVRLLARPGIVGLRDGGYAVLSALDDGQATLQVGRQRFVLSLPALARVWRGDFATFWKLPPGAASAASLGPQGLQWVDRQLAAAGFDGDGPLRNRVSAFQIVQGLTPDGVAGPMTQMRLNRAAGVAEPNLGR